MSTAKILTSIILCGIYTKVSFTIYGVRVDEFILASLKDIGGLNNLLPVINELAERGHKIKIVASASGVAAETLKKNNIRFTLGEDVARVAERFPNPKLMITSMCSVHDIGKGLVSLLRNTCPTVAIQDYWGVRLTNEWGAPEYRPDYITVNDSLGAELVRRAWPEFEPSHIWQTGFPMFDAYSNINETDAVSSRTEILTKLNKQLDSTIIFFPCGALTGAGQFLSEILEVLHSRLTDKNSVQPIIFIPRHHPRLKKEPFMAPELKLWDKAVGEFESYHPGVTVTDETVIKADMKTLLLASDIVISDYSTSLLEAGLIGAKLGGKPNISACYIPAIARDMRKDLGTQLEEPPFVTLGCSAKAKDKTDLKNLITLFLNESNDTAKNSLKEKQKEHLKVDGCNSKRVADLIETLW